jgi:hypothetical protein
MTQNHEASESGIEPGGPLAIDLQSQEIPLHDVNSRFRFDLLEKQLVGTRGAIEEFGAGVIQDCVELLGRRAKEYDGLDYLQVFTIGPAKKNLWFIEDGQTITALLPSEY